MQLREIWPKTFMNTLTNFISIVLESFDELEKLLQEHAQVIFRVVIT